MARLSKKDVRKVRKAIGKQMAVLKPARKPKAAKKKKKKPSVPKLSPRKSRVPGGMRVTPRVQRGSDASVAKRLRGKPTRP